MNNVFVLMKRQLRAYVYTPTAAVILASFLVVSGLSFCRPLSRRLGEQVALGELLFQVPAFWVAVLGAAALLTIPLLAEERRSGAWELLVTAPLTDLQIVLGKYAAALLFFMTLTALPAAYFILLRLMAPGLAGLDLRPVASGCLLVWLMGSAFLAIGLWVSALTRQPAVAAAGAFLAGGALIFWDSWQLFWPAARGPAWLAHLSGVSPIEDFARGVLDTRPLVLYLSLSVFFLFVAVKTVEARRWR